MLIVFIQHPPTAVRLLQSGGALARRLKKRLGVFYHSDKGEAARQAVAEALPDVTADFVLPMDAAENLAAHCEEREASLLMMQWDGKNRRQLKRYLAACRALRIPYLFFKNSFPALRYEKVVVPIGFLPEEYEKAQFASAFGRFCAAEITLLQANDYGSKAAATVEKIEGMLEKVGVHYRTERAVADSFSLDKEAVAKAEKENAGMVLITASRDYGLDDLLFGPKEQRLVQKSTVPLLLINPRGDLYTLCD